MDETPKIALEVTRRPEGGGFISASRKLRPKRGKNKWAWLRNARRGCGEWVLRGSRVVVGGSVTCLDGGGVWRG